MNQDSVHVMKMLREELATVVRRINMTDIKDAWTVLRAIT
jgi:hypothetical protein